MSGVVHCCPVLSGVVRRRTHLAGLLHRPLPRSGAGAGECRRRTGAVHAVVRFGGHARGSSVQNQNSKLPPTLRYPRELSRTATARETAGIQRPLTLR